eukprot:jgi/Hompol1/5589/HPOL_004588-RA
MDQDKATKEQRILKQRVETLERENMLLRKSLYELSRSYNSLAHKLQPFNLGEILDSALDTGINSLLETSETDASPDRFDSGTDMEASIAAISFPSTAESHAAVNREKLSSKDSKHFYLKQELKVCIQPYRVPFLDSPRFNILELICFYNNHALQGHTGAVYAVQYSPCGRFISSGAHDKTVRIWDQKELNVLRGHTLNVSDLSWSSDSTELVSGAYDQTCKTWDVETSKLIESYNTEGFTHVNRSDLTPASYYAQLTVIRVYDRGLAPPLNPYRLVHTLKGYKNRNWTIKSAFFKGRDVGSSLRGTSTDDMFTKNEATKDNLDSASFDKDKSIFTDTLLATGSADPFVYVYSLGLSEGTSELVQRLEGHTDRVYAVSFHPNDPILCSCSADFTIKVWHSSTGKRK